MKKRLYFDNAATSFPKPECVYEIMDQYARHIGASAGRGAYREAVESGEIISAVRRSINTLIGGENPDHVILTFNCTDGLSLAIKGLITQSDQHVITTRMDHNSILRPLATLRNQRSIDVTYIDADGKGLVDPDDIRKAIRSNTKLIALLHGSNVCGSVLDIEAIAQIAREHEIFLLVDAAQTIGHVLIDVQKLGIDMIAFPGHKGLLGPLGTGALYIRPGLEKQILPLREGGTGSKSEIPRQPEFLPDRFEAGSHNAVGLAGLNASVQYLNEFGIDHFRKHEKQLCAEFIERARGVANLTVYGPDDIDQRVGVFSVSIDGFEPAELAAILEDQFGLLTRPGLHCAPYAHQTLGTFDLGGTTRFSTGPFTTVDDVIYATNALAQIAASCVNT